MLEESRLVKQSREQGRWLIESGFLQQVGKGLEGDPIFTVTNFNVAGKLAINTNRLVNHRYRCQSYFYVRLIVVFRVVFEVFFSYYSVFSFFVISSSQLKFFDD